jgi:hypothetical protein
LIEKQQRPFAPGPALSWQRYVAKAIIRCSHDSAIAFAANRSSVAVGPRDDLVANSIVIGRSR